VRSAFRSASSASAREKNGGKRSVGSVERLSEAKTLFFLPRKAGPSHGQAKASLQKKKWEPTERFPPWGFRWGCRPG